MNQYLINSRKFKWGPGVVSLNPEKADLLKKYALGKVLDVGCGSGIYSNYLQSLGHPVTGIDSQKEFIVAATRKFPAVKFVKGSAENPPKSLKSFDTIVLFDILEHIDDDKVITAVKKIGQRFIISVPIENQEILTRYALSHAHHLDQTHRRYYSLKSLKALLIKHKLKIVCLQPSLPISVSGFLIERLSNHSSLTRIILKIILKPFLPEPPLYSTIFAVAEV